MKHFLQDALVMDFVTCSVFLARLSQLLLLVILYVGETRQVAVSLQSLFCFGTGGFRDGTLRQS